MKRTSIISRGRRICDLLNNTNLQSNNSDTPIENDNISLNEIELNSFPDSSLRNIIESPLPISFNESEINELANIIDADIFDNNPEVASDSDSASLETPHPSPSCSTNHLDYDCDNDFCPYYIQKENLSTFDILPVPSPGYLILSSCSTYTTINNYSPLSDISNNSPSTSDRRRQPRKDKGNIRKRHFNEWIDTKRKNLRNMGKEYMSRNGKIQAKRKMGPPCHCRKKCFDKLSEGERQKIFESFWSLGNREKQWMYIASLVKKQNKRRVYTDTTSRRKYTLKYSLPLDHGEDNYVNVCKKHFLSTISVSDQVINKALEKMDTTTGVLIPDQRGRHSNHPVKKTESVITSVYDHIKSLQPVESHFTRQRSNKLYLDGDINFHKLFEMYNEWLQSNTYEEKTNSERLYRDIVNEKFKLSFYIPKKDQCDQCHIFRNINSPTEQQVMDHEIHVTNKKLSRQLMQLIYKS